MELLKPQPQLKFRDDWPVFSAAKSPPGDVNGRIINSIISPGCVVEGYVENSILSPGVYVDKQAEVINSIVMDNTSIGYHSIVDRCMLDEDVMIGGYCYLGFGSSPVNGVWDITLLGKEVNVPPQTSIGRKCKILPGLGLNAFASRMVSSGTVVSASV
jgi:glucose-1-phosphate adenylyltransferase